VKAARDRGAATIVVVGPLHPDLFGGDTPMVVEVTAREAKRLRRHRIDVHTGMQGVARAASGNPGAYPPGGEFRGGLRKAAERGL